MLRTSARASQKLRLPSATTKCSALLSRSANANTPAPLLLNSQYARSFHLSALLKEVVKVPQMAESISEGTLKQWLKKKGDYVEVDEEVATIETDKIDVSVNAPTAGTIVELFAEEEDTVAVGNDLFKIEEGEKPSGGSEKAAPEPEKKEPEKKAEEPKQAENQESKRKPSQESDAVKQKEPEPQREAPKATEARQPSPQPPKPTPSASAEKPAAPKGEQSSGQGNRTERRVKMNSMRKRIAERLKQSQNTAASLTTFNEIDMSSLMAMRGQYKDKILKDKAIKLGFMGMFTRAACLALQEFPAANASIEGPGYGDQIVYHDFVDVSVAVATPKGLVVPVIRNAEGMSVLEVEEEIARLGKLARDNKLTLEQMTGGTFTISNGGVFGSLYGTPIINSPQSAVLGLHAIKEKPVAVNGKVEIRPIMVVALTYDHRLLDGREAVSVLVRIKELIEDPRFMLLQ